MMINKNKVKLVEKKIYGMMIELADINFLSIQCAESLEEAFVLAKLEFEQQNAFPNGIPFNVKIGLFTLKTVHELISAPTLQDILDAQQQTNKKVKDTFKILNAKSKTELLGIRSQDKVDPLGGDLRETNKTKKVNKKNSNTEKNSLMEFIIKTKDKTMLEKNKSLFTVAEREYLKKQLK